ncbi:MAG: Crp/Fnr family transcriptional regulator [Silvanigrellaceae bacterium]
MAGQTRILKEGEILFRTGEQATSMYIVRRGSLKVYFLKGNEEVQLALLNEGAIVGEMAFFDQKPRSAHVKALTQAEINEITRADFDKLLTQIPKWLFTMLQSLSGRLRTTNDKLEALEKAHLGASQAAVSDFPFIPLVRSLRIIQLLTHQIGQKDGVNVWLDWQATLDWWMSLTGWSRDYFVRFMTTMEKHGLLSKRGDEGKAPRIVLTARARLQLVTDFLVQVQSRASMQSAQNFSPAWISLLEAVIGEASASGYESYNVPVTTLPATYPGVPTDPKIRMQIAEELAHWLQLKITKSNVEILVKISPKEHKNTPVLLKMLHAFISDRLDTIG